MSKVQAFFERARRSRKTRAIRPIVETLEGMMVGTRENTLGPPHIRDHIEIKRYMASAILALLPTTVAAVVFFGSHILWAILVSYAVGGVVEVAFAFIRHKDIEEGFLVTGLILPLTLPPTVPLWVVAVASVVGVFFGKEVFGGTGRNIFNPALVGRLFVTIAFPGIMSTRWQAPFSDAITSATPLSVYKSSQVIPEYSDLLFGQVAGSAGEIFRIGIIVGGLYLILTRITNWRIPTIYLATVFVGASIGHSLNPELFAPALFQLLAGGLLFGAFFMATDPVTSPTTGSGKVIFAIGCGVLTLVIRTFTGFTEGVMFSIVLMNAFAPLIDTFVIDRRFPAVQP